MNELNTNVLFYESEILRRVRELGEQISARYAGEPLVCVCVLRGAVTFFTDLMKCVDNDELTYDFISVSSYANTAEGVMSTTGNVRLLTDVRDDVKDKHVLVVEDIADSGSTVQFLRRHFEDKGARSVAVAVLIDKPTSRKVDAEVDYAAFTLEKCGFIIGYGLDYDQKYRNLDAVCEVIE